MDVFTGPLLSAAARFPVFAESAPHGDRLSVSLGDGLRPFSKTVQSNSV